MTIIPPAPPQILRSAAGPSCPPHLCFPQHSAHAVSPNTNELSGPSLSFYSDSFLLHSTTVKGCLFPTRLTTAAVLHTVHLEMKRDSHTPQTGNPSSGRGKALLRRGGLERALGSIHTGNTQYGSLRWRPATEGG